MFVYDFAAGSKDMADLLGGKGANLAEMTHLGLPVPAGFTITTEACRAFLEHGTLPGSLTKEISEHVQRIETTMGRRLGDTSNPLLLSVRSGARYSMPGMMETILDIGLNDDSVVGLASASGDERFAWDSYRRLIQMFGHTVCDVPAERFAHALDACRRAAGAANDAALTASDLRGLVDEYKKIFFEHTGDDFPQEPRHQLLLAVAAVFESWNTARAKVYRRREHISEDLGTAVNVMAMVFGNRGPSSGTGVAFTRDPATGERGIYGDYLSNAQGEDVVAGVRNAIALQQLEQLDKRSFDQLAQYMSTLEHHYRDLCDIEFTIEDGTLWMLQVRVGKRTAAAAFVIAMQLVDEGLIDMDEALRRVNGEQLAQLLYPGFDLSSAPAPLTAGVPASPGAASGRVVFDSRRAAAAEGPVVLVRRETSPEDLPGMVAAVGILTSRGGKTSHAAVVARGMGKVCVCGAEEVDVDVRRREFSVSGTVVREGDLISIDGTTGRIYLGSLPVQASPVLRYFDGAAATKEGVVAAVARLMVHADARRRLGVWANADNGPDVARSRRFGADGVGLCRTEHMFLGERRVLVEQLILAADDGARQVALEALLPLQRQDFIEILEAADGQPVTIRLLDPPLHEFLPALDELAVRVARAEAAGEDPGHDEVLLSAVRRMHEQNPMLGLRGVRLAIEIPGLIAMQVRAVAEATMARIDAGGDPRPEIMVPLVATRPELFAVRAEIERVLRDYQWLPRIPIGTMIEVPRAALLAGEIASCADFFSFGTNDLTQLTWGLSRDDAEASFLVRYLQQNIVEISPFESLDVDGVGQLVRTAVVSGRATRPRLPIGVCGEHGGDPASIHFFHAAGLDYVSCSPFRVPVARLEAGRAALDVRASSADSR